MDECIKRVLFISNFAKNRLGEFGFCPYSFLIFFSFSGLVRVEEGALWSQTALSGEKEKKDKKRERKTKEWKEGKKKQSER